MRGASGMRNGGVHEEKMPSTPLPRTPEPMYFKHQGKNTTLYVFFLTLPQVKQRTGIIILLSARSCCGGVCPASRVQALFYDSSLNNSDILKYENDGKQGRECVLRAEGPRKDFAGVDKSFTQQ
jgi:hypothetical protein